MIEISYGLNLGLDVFVTLLHVVAIGLTIFRLYYRRRTHRLWWDDYTAGLATLIDFGYFPTLWFSYTPSGSLLNSRKGVITKYWLSLMLLFVVLWCTRVSIALAIASVFPPGKTIRRFAIGLAVFFAFLFTTITTRFLVVCAKQTTNPARPIHIPCVWSTDFTFLLTIGNLLSDILLVATPLYRLWRVRLPRKQRRLILAGFAASVLTTMPSIACAVFLFAPASWEPGRQYLRIKLGHLVVSVSLTACNLLVVITYTHNVRRHGEELARPMAPETCETRNANLIPHSNQVPNSSALSTLRLTEITDAYVSTVDPTHQPTSGAAPSSASNSD